MNTMDRAHLIPNLRRAFSREYLTYSTILTDREIYNLWMDNYGLGQDRFSVTLSDMHFLVAYERLSADADPFQMSHVPMMVAAE